MADFFSEFFCKPIETYSGYNPINTIVYAAVMLVAAFVIYKLLDRRGIRFNSRFALSVLAFVLLGSSFRILEDLKILPRSCNLFDPAFYTITPGIYIATAALTLAALFVSLFAAKRFKKNFYNLFGAIGLLLALPIVVFLFLHFKQPSKFLLIIFLAAAIVMAIFFVFGRLKKKILADKLNLLALAGQALDGCATFVAMQFGNCGEQHFAPAALIQAFGPWSFIVVKVAIVLLILWYLDKEIKNENLRGFIKLVVIILGFATGTRDLFTVGVGTCG